MTYHYLITLTWNPDPRSTRTRWVEDLITARPADTRRTLVMRAVQEAKDAAQAPDTAVVLFLSLEPNELPS